MQLLRDQFLQYRIEIEPDSIVRADYAALKNDRVEYVTAIGQFIGQVLPLAEKSPEAAAPLVEIIKWVSTGFRGGAQIESVLDKAMNGLLAQQKQKQGQQQQPPPEVQAEQMRQKAEQQKAQMRLQEAQLKAQAKLAEEKAKHEANMREMQTEHQLKLQEIQAELQADMQREQKQAEYGSLENLAKEQAKTVEEYRRPR
jgi:primosomal protein N'